MDQFSAHLDRGWDLVQRGDSTGAEVSARRALELDSQSPEAHNLLGYVAALQGEFEDAIESYREAIALDDTYLEAMLNAAEVYIHPLGEFEEAISMCDQALDLAETDDERVDALLLKFDALVGMGEAERAKELCDSFPEGPFENPNHTFLVGRAYYETGDLERAAPLITDAVKQAAHNPEALYYLGLVRDEQGDAHGATQAFLRARELDLTLPAPPWTLSRDTFALTVERAIMALPAHLADRVRDAEIYVADIPGVEVVVEGVDPRALVLFDSVPTPEGGAADPQQSGTPASRQTGSAEPTPATRAATRLFVYQRNVERMAGSVELVEAELVGMLTRELENALVVGPATPADSQ